MINTNQIDKKLEYAGISTVRVDSYEKLKRTVHVLIKVSSEQSDYIVHKLCETNPYIAAECIIDTKKSNAYKEQIIEAVKKADIPDIFKVITFYRYDEFSECQKISLQFSVEDIDVENIFKSWNDFCRFVCWITRTETKIDWIFDLIKEKNISISALYQNKLETKQLLDALLANGYLDSLKTIFNKIGIENYYVLSEHRYEDIQGMFDTDMSSIPDQIIYCWTDSLKRGENLFSYFHLKNTFLKKDASRSLIALLYEYLVTSDDDKEFIERGKALSSKENKARSLSRKKKWRKIIAEALILCVQKCIKEKRNFAILKDMIEPINFFSFNNSMATGLDVIDAENIKVDEVEAKTLFIEYVQEMKNTDVMDVYLNSYLKFVISLDIAIRIVFENVSKENFNSYLNKAVFPAKISHKDSEKVIIRLRNLSSRAYTPERDSILCEEIAKNEKIFARFQFDEEIGLVVSCIGNDADKLKNTSNYSELTTEYIKDIMDIAAGNITEVVYNHLSLHSEVPMGYVKHYFSELLDSLGRIEDINAFKKTIIALNWNKKYLYAPGRVYESTDVEFFAKYNQEALKVLKRIYEAGLSESDVISVYMNSFFKLTNTIKDLRFLKNIDIETVRKKYVFVGNNRNGKIRLVSVKDIDDAIYEYPVADKFKKIDSYIYRLKRYDSSSLEFEFCEDKTIEYVLPSGIKRMLRAYNTISSNTSVGRYEYEYIKMISSDFFLDDNEVCRKVSDCTIKATQIRYKSFQSLNTMIANLGNANIYGEDFFPILMYSKISHFSNDEYDMAKRLCYSFIRNSEDISQALHLFINTYVKGKVSFSDYFRMCEESKLNRNPCEHYMNAVAIIHVNGNNVIFSFVDISIEDIDVSQISHYIDKTKDGSRYYVRIKIQFDGDFKTSVCSIWNVDRTEKYSVE